MNKQRFTLAHDEARRRAVQAVESAPAGSVVTIGPASKSRDQEAMYHALFSDIAATRTFLGKKHEPEVWKRLLVDAFAKAKAEEGDPLPGINQIMPALDGIGVVQLGFQTRTFSKAHASEFIEFLHAWMATGGAA